MLRLIVSAVMRSCAFLAALTVLYIFSGSAVLQAKEMTGAAEQKTDTIGLPEPVQDSKTSVEKALRKRRSVRNFKDSLLTVAEVSQLLWAAQGITSQQGLRTAPSAGALYPLEVYLVAGNVSALPAGVYRYRPMNHEVVRVLSGDKRRELCNAAMGQPSVRHAGAVIVIAAVYERTTLKYGDRGRQYVHMETGHAAQNVLLQAVSLNLGTVVIGAFQDAEVQKVLKMSGGEQPLCVIPVGRVK